MKVKTINRSEEEFTRERAQDVVKVHRNLDPALHPLERAREVMRALNAAKLSKVNGLLLLVALWEPHQNLQM